MQRLHLLVVDLTVFLLAASYGIDIAIMQPFLFDKTCRSLLGPNDSLSKCENTSVDHQFELKVEESTSNFMQILSVSQHIPTLLVIPFIGTYSDLYGRRGAILFSILGLCVKYLLSIYAATYENSSIYILVAGAVACGLTGFIAIGSCFALYVDLIADPTLRTIRLGFASSEMALGILSTSLIGGVIVDRLNYGYAFMLAEACVCLATLAAVFLPEGPKIAAPLRVKLKNSCNYRRSLEMIRLITMPREGKHRVFLVSGVGLMIALSLLQGQSGVLVLFLKVAPFNWSTERLAQFGAIEAAAAAISMGLVTYIFKRILKLDDTIVILFSFTIMSLRSVLLAVSTQSIEIYIAGIITVFAHLHWPACRAFISDQVTIHEIGRIFAMISLIENVTPVLSTVLYNNVYNSTISFLPAFVFYMSAGFGVALIGFVVWLHIMFMRNKLPESNSSEDEAPILCAADETVDSADFKENEHTSTQPVAQHSINR